MAPPSTLREQVCRCAANKMMCGVDEAGRGPRAGPVFAAAVMVELHVKHPAYGFDRHKGYATQAHLDALRAHGACIVHRRSFAPVRLALDQLCLWEQGASAST